MSETERISCEEALRQLLFYLDEELPAPKREKVREHLERCRSCWSRSEFESRLKSQLVGLGQVPVRPELEARIRQLVSGDSIENGV